MTRRNTTQRDRDRQRIKQARPPCALCGQPIDYTLCHPHPMSFVVDHVIPLAQGGVDDLANKQATHRSCNRDKGDRLPDLPGRRVVLICGPPGAGKSTYAHSLDIKVYDLDDVEWAGDNTAFRAALVILGRTRDANAAVIRSAATLSARQKAARLCGATETRVIETDLNECIQRIKYRGRTDPPIREQIAAARNWWSQYEPGTPAPSVHAGGIRRSGSLTRVGYPPSPAASTAPAAIGDFHAQGSQPQEAV